MFRLFPAAAERRWPKEPAGGHRARLRERSLGSCLSEGVKEAKHLFKPGDYEDKMQLLGKLIGEELGVEFINCRYVGENLAFKGVFR